MVLAEGYGYGSIYHREKDNRWVGAVVIPTARGEKRRRKVLYGKTRAEVEAKIADHRAQNPAPEHLGKAVYLERARAQGRHTHREWWALVRSVGCTCEYCGERIPNGVNPSKDHRVPLSRGGSDAIENIAVSCWPCNQDKGTMTADEYAEWKSSRG